MYLGSQKVLSSILRVCNRYTVLIFTFCGVAVFWSLHNFFPLKSVQISSRARQHTTSAEGTLLGCLQYQNGTASEIKQSRIYTFISSPILRRYLKLLVVRQTSSDRDNACAGLLRQCQQTDRAGLVLMFDVRVRRLIHQKPTNCNVISVSRCKHNCYIGLTIHTVTHSNEVDPNNS
jgi:hypothetical protein